MLQCQHIIMLQRKQIIMHRHQKIIMLHGSSRGRPKLAQKRIKYHEYNNSINIVLWECIPLLYYGYNYKAVLR